MKRKSSLTKKEKLYATAGVALILIIILILGIIAYNNLFGNNKRSEGRIIMTLDDEKIISGTETSLKILIQNTGKELLEGNLSIIADDPSAVNVTHQDTTVLNVKLYPKESVTRILNVKGRTNAIRTDYKIFAELVKNNETISSNDVVLTVTRE